MVLILIRQRSICYVFGLTGFSGARGVTNVVWDKRAGEIGPGDVDPDRDRDDVWSVSPPAASALSGVGSPLGDGGLSPCVLAATLVGPRKVLGVTGPFDAPR